MERDDDGRSRARDKTIGNTRSFRIVIAKVDPRQYRDR
jgi:hypothetical protein